MWEFSSSFQVEFLANNRLKFMPDFAMKCTILCVLHFLQDPKQELCPGNVALQCGIMLCIRPLFQLFVCFPVSILLRLWSTYLPACSVTHPVVDVSVSHPSTQASLCVVIFPCRQSSIPLSIHLSTHVLVHQSLGPSSQWGILPSVLACMFRVVEDSQSSTVRLLCVLSTFYY